MSGGFADLGLMPELLRAVEDVGWILPTDIQDESIPLILGGGDVMGAAETGSGKTAAFGLPVLQLVHERLKSTQDASTSANSLPRKRQHSSSSNEDHVVNITLNPNDRDSSIQITDDNLRCSHIPQQDSGGPSAWAGIRATHGVREGKYAFEVIVQPPAGHCRVGWSTMSAHLMLGKDGQGFGYGGTGFKSHDGNFDKYGEIFSAGDVITCYLDLGASSSKKTISFSKNGLSLGIAFTIEEDLVGSVFFPAVAFSNGAVAQVNFGQSAARYPLELGYQWIHQASSSGELFGCEQSESYVVQGKRLPLAIILEPTRDLAEQVYQNLLDLSRYIQDPDLQLMLLIGEGNHQQVKQTLKKTGVDIIVGTLGKVEALLQQRQLDLSHIRHFILDEADKMLSPENFESIKYIFGKCPGGGTGDHRLQVCFFSATLHSPAIQSLAASICHNPLFVDLKGKDLVPETLHHVVYVMDPQIDYNSRASDFCSSSGSASSTAVLPITDGVHGEDLKGQVKSALSAQDALSLRMKQQKMFVAKHLIDRFAMQQVLIFCRTNLDCLNLQSFFQQISRSQQQNTNKGTGGGSIVVERYSSRVLGSSLSQEERRASLASFKAQESRILICTDVAARGIDIDSLPYVINMTLPDEPEHYLHRIGRTGRRGFTGLAISIVNLSGPERVWFHTCKTRGGQLSNHRYACQNFNLTSANGCTVYYDESHCLQKIETHLHNVPILRMNPLTMELPEELRVLNIRYGDAGKESGESTNAGAKKVYMTEKVVGRLRSLVELETQAQNFFLSLQTH